MKFIGFYNYTVILTYLSLISGFGGILAATQGKLGLAVICLGFSGFCDMFDGMVARTKKNRTADEKNFGIQIDSLCDMICFGVLPGIYLYFSGLNTPWGVGIAAFYVLCALIRLAFFNVLESRRQQKEDGCAKFYRGMPVTTAAIIFPAVYVIGLLLPDPAVAVTYHILPVIMGILFIADFRVPKLDISKFFRKQPVN